MSVSDARIAPTERVSGETTARMLEDRLLGLVFTGRFDESVVVQCMSRMRELRGISDARLLHVDATRINAVDPGVAESSRELFVQLRSYGVREIFCASTSPAVRMLGVGLGLATGVHFHAYTTADEALLAAQAAGRARR
jgi:hypothetical protein